MFALRSLITGISSSHFETCRDAELPFGYPVLLPSFRLAGPSPTAYPEAQITTHLAEKWRMGYSFTQLLFGRACTVPLCPPFAHKDSGRKEGGRIHASGERRQREKKRRRLSVSENLCDGTASCDRCSRGQRVDACVVRGEVSVVRSEQLSVQRTN